MKRGFVLVFLIGVILILLLNFISAGLLNILKEFFNPTIGGKVIDSGEGLVSYWSFDGNADDSSGNGNNGIVNGPVLTTGKINQAYSFNGVNDYISITNEAPFDFERTDKLSIALWLKPDATDTSIQVPISKMKDSSPFTGWNFVINFGGGTNVGGNGNTPGKVAFQVINKLSDNSIEVSTTAATNLNDGNWHYYVITYDGSSSANGVKIYEDDIELSLSVTRNFLASSILNNYKVTIGDREGGNTGLSYKGLIDEVKVWDRSLSDSEIKELYEGYLSMPKCGDGKKETGEQCDDGNTVIGDGCDSTCKNELNYVQQCNDSIDNDGDGKIDYPSDPGCSSADDNDESDVINTTCIDSDGGKNYNVGGDTCVGKDCKKDNCVELQGNPLYNLVEYYCQSSTDRGSVTFNCPNGCSNGACVIKNVSVSNVTCTDSDGGKDIFKKGITRGLDWTENKILTETDYCITEGEKKGRLVEFYCKKVNSEVRVGSESFGLEDGCDLCKEGACISTDHLQSCQELIDFVKNPQGFIDKGIGYDLLWNQTQRINWWINNEEKELTQYYANWKIINSDKEETNVYIVLEVSVFDDNSVDALSEIEKRNQDVVCKQTEIWSRDDKLNTVYICNWNILYGKQDLDNYDYNHRDIYWVKDNVIIRIETSEDKYLSEEELKKLRDKFLLEFLQDLQDNEYEYVDWSNFEISWKAANLISKIIGQCPSRIKEKEIDCEPYWQCKTEPLICPPHGYQTKICRDINNNCDDGKRAEVETRQYCSPGICSGCYIPRHKEARDNVCIPYGTRLILDKGEENRIYEYEMNREGEGYFEVLINNEESMTINVKEDFPYDNVVISVDGETYYIKKGESKTIYEGRTYDVIVEQNKNYREEYSITIKNIHYSDNSEDRYLDIIFNEDYPAFCDYTGDIRQQKTKDYQGNWAKCQNNYECESNVCSSGECIEIADAIRKAKGIKGLLIKIVCRFGNLFDIQEYNQCLADYL